MHPEKTCRKKNHAADMQMKFLARLVLLLFLNFLVKPFWIFEIDGSAQNALGAGEYSFYFTILNSAILPGISNCCACLTSGHLSGF